MVFDIAEEHPRAPSGLLATFYRAPALDFGDIAAASLLSTSGNIITERRIVAPYALWRAPFRGQLMSTALRSFVPLLALNLCWSPIALAAAPPADPAPTPPAEAPARTEMRQDPQLKRAMESYELGNTAYNNARYDDALGHFQQAATLYASADFQYNIGLCYERLGKPEEAIRAFKTYLRAKPTAGDRANVEDRIFQLEKEIADQKAGNPPEAAPPPVETAPAEPVDDGPPPNPTAGRGLIIGGAAMAGVGVLIGIAGGAGFGAVAASRSDDLEEIQGGENLEKTFAEAQTLDEEGQRAETLQIVSAAVGGAFAITGVALLVVGLRKRKAAAQSPSASIVPTFGKHAAGLSLQGRF